MSARTASAANKVKRSFFRDSAWLTLALSTYNASNLVLSVLLARLMTKHEFGQFNALLSLLFAASITASAIQLFLTRELSSSSDTVRESSAFNGVRRLVQWTSLAAVIGVSVSSMRIADFLHVESPAAVVVAGVLLACSLVLPLFRGVLQGRRRFSGLTVNIALEAGARVALAVLVVRLGGAVTGALAALVGASLLAGLAAWYVTDADRRKLRCDNGAIAASARELVPIVASVGLVTGLFSLDVLGAQHYGSHTFGGEYAALSLTARLLFFLTSAIGGVVVASDPLPDARETLALLGKALGVVLGAAVPIEVLFLASGRTVLRIFFGPSYAHIASTLPILGVGMIALATSNILVAYLISVRGRGYVSIVAGALTLEALLIHLHHSSLEAIAWAFSFSAFFALLGLSACVTRNVIRLKPRVS